MGGHSRGHLTACRFKADFGNSYENLLVLGFDGSFCGQTGRQGVFFFSNLREEEIRVSRDKNLTRFQEPNPKKRMRS